MTTKIRHPLYGTWKNMVYRCHVSTSDAYEHYGARGIHVCDEWRSDFWTFVAYVGPKPIGAYTIDRIDNSLGYQPGNVRWATKAEQRRNSRQSPEIFDGKTLGEWSAITGVPTNTLFNRIKLGWPIEAALSAPVRMKKPRYTILPKGALEECRQRELPVGTIAARIARGWSYERALSAPIQPRRRV